MDTMLFLVMFDTLCGGPATTSGSAYLECTPDVGDTAYCPGDAPGYEDEDGECRITHVVRLPGGRSIVRWEASPDSAFWMGGAK